MDGIGRPLFRRRLGRGKMREECRNWPRDVAVKCSGKASRGVTAFERRQCRKTNVFFFEEHRSRLHYPTFPPDKIGRKFRESFDRPCVPSTRGERGGIKAMPRSYKSEEGNESTKLAKIVEIAEARSSISKRRSEQKPGQKRSPFTRFESRSIRKARRVIDF